VAERTGRPLEGMDRQLKDMGKAGQLFSIDFGGIRVFKMLPWVFGIYEFQLGRLDKELALLVEEYAPFFRTAVLFPNASIDG